MSKIEKILASLGAEYSIRTIDCEPCIYRDLGNGYDFEVSGVANGGAKCDLYVWKLGPGKEIVGAYCGIDIQTELKDTLGHYAFLYRGLTKKIRVEREGLTE